MRIIAVLFAILAWTGSSAGQSRAALEFDHVWIVVSPNAPEREMLERAGFRIAPTVHRHEGQGAASIRIEFRNGYLELLWPDASVPTAPSNESIAAQFRNRSAWRENGWSPIGVALRRTAAAPDKLPFDSWPVSAPGGAIDMLTPRTQGKAVSIFVVPRSLAHSEGSIMEHPNGAQLITKVSVAVPSRAHLPAVAQRIGDETLEFVEGPEWLVEITLDGGMKQRSRDFGPALPLVIHF